MGKQYTSAACPRPVKVRAEVMLPHILVDTCIWYFCVHTEKYLNCLASCNDLSICVRGMGACALSPAQSSCCCKHSCDGRACCRFFGTLLATAAHTLLAAAFLLNLCECAVSKWFLLHCHLLMILPHCCCFITFLQRLFDTAEAQQRRKPSHQEIHSRCF